MKKQQQAAPEYTTDANGQQLVHVALANTDQRATLHAEDFHRWLDAGFSRYWSFVSTGGQNQYVLANARSPTNSLRSLTVARWIAKAGRGQLVSYADGDRLNLRRDNLELVRGPAKASSNWVRPNDGTPPRRKPKPETQESAAVILWPAETLKLVASTVDSHRKSSSHVSLC
jgi:hypothetical protein